MKGRNSEVWNIQLEDKYQTSKLQIVYQQTIFKLSIKI